MWNVKEAQIKGPKTLTGHDKQVSHLHVSPTCLITCDESGVLASRDFASPINNLPGRRRCQETLVMFQNFFLHIFSRITSCDEGINSFSAGPDTLLCGLLSKSVQVFSRSAVGVQGGKETAKHLAMGDNHIFGLAQVLDRHTVFSI